VIVEVLNREILDHTSLLLSTGDEAKTKKQPPFKFELGWLLKDGVFQVASEVWKKENKGGTPMQRWQNKIRRLRQFLRGWANNMNGVYKKRKARIVQESGGTR
jgi:hypothetical protein